jgi:hypothetical protein
MVAPRRLSILPQAVGVLRGRSRHRGVGWRRGRECVNHGRDGHVVEGSKLYARSTGASVRALRPSADRVAALGHRRDGLAGGGPDRGIAPRVASKQPESARLRGAATRDLRRVRHHRSRVGPSLDWSRGYGTGGAGRDLPRRSQLRVRRGWQCRRGPDGRVFGRGPCAATHRSVAARIAGHSPAAGPTGSPFLTQPPGHLHQPLWQSSSTHGSSGHPTDGQVAIPAPSPPPRVQPRRPPVQRRCQRWP